MMQPPTGLRPGFAGSQGSLVPRQPWAVGFNAFGVGQEARPQSIISPSLVESEQGLVGDEQTLFESEQGRVGDEQDVFVSEQGRSGDEQGVFVKEQGRSGNERDVFESEQGRSGDEQGVFVREQGRSGNEPSLFVSEQTLFARKPAFPANCWGSRSYGNSQCEDQPCGPLR